MNILILEDGVGAIYLTEMLKDIGHKAYHAFSLLEAQDIWQSTEVHCLIVDLMLDPTGLTDDEICRSKCGCLTGWIWLSNYIFPEFSHMRDRTIIVSEYIEELKKYCNESELQGVTLIHKFEGSKSMLGRILEIARMLER